MSLQESIGWNNTKVGSALFVQSESFLSFNAQFYTYGSLKQLISSYRLLLSPTHYRVTRFVSVFSTPVTLLIFGPLVSSFVEDEFAISADTGL